MRLNEQQKKAVVIKEKAHLLLAAAGSGKTSVLVSRYLEGLKKGMRPSQILAITFTTDAAHQMKQRILDKLKDSADKKLREEFLFQSAIQTIDSFCFSLIEEWATSCGFPMIQEVLTEERFSILFQETFLEWSRELEEEEARGLFRHFTYDDASALGEFLYKKRFLILSDQYKGPSGLGKEIYERLISILSSLVKILEERSFKQGYYTYSDLGEVAKCILESEDIVSKVRDGFKMILVDEFQDTSLLQWEIIQRISQENLRNVFMVGDANQSIYRFRGADLTVFSQALKKIQDCKGEVTKLSINYRTGKRVLEKINNISKGLFQSSSFPLIEMEGVHEGGEVFWYQAKDFEEEKGLAHEILSHVEKGEEVAFLFRVSERIPDLAHYLESRGIACHWKKSLDLFRSLTIQGVSSYLHFMADPLEPFWAIRFLRSIFIDFPEQRLLELREKGVAFFMMLSQLPEIDWVLRLIEKGEVRVGALLEELLYHGNTQNVAWPLLEQFLNIIVPYDNVWDAVKALEALGRGRFQVSMDENKKSSIHIITVHASKGLEFDHVILMDLKSGTNNRKPLCCLDSQNNFYFRFLHSGEWVDCEGYHDFWEREKSLQEEEGRRLLYVALTRVKKKLHIILPPKDSASKGTFASYLWPEFEKEKGFIDCEI